MFKNVRSVTVSILLEIAFAGSHFSSESPLQFYLIDNRINNKILIVLVGTSINAFTKMTQIFVFSSLFYLNEFQ